MLYWLLKWIFIGPLLKAVFRPEASGAENVPGEGPAILACNHLSYTDWLSMPLVSFSGRFAVANRKGH